MRKRPLFINCIHAYTDPETIVARERMATIISNVFSLHTRGNGNKGAKTLKTLIIKAAQEGFFSVQTSLPQPPYHTLRYHKAFPKDPFTRTGQTVHDLYCEQTTADIRARFESCEGYTLETGAYYAPYFRRDDDPVSSLLGHLSPHNHPTGFVYPLMDSDDAYAEECLEHSLWDTQHAVIDFPSEV
ncbi:MAG: hypothetical protein H6849_00480 [Alphaproteobacteria bacterium]|nr:MAG: hypothetical protein H6849_00480 [Alphaproteobacteria bacterium]